jgi:VanZ family protein
VIRRGIALGFALLALAWAGVIFWSSSRSNPYPSVPPWILEHDKVLHTLEYALLGALLRGALAGTGLRARTALLLTFLGGTVYGATDEVHQRFVPQRECDPRDLAADATGAVLGALAAGLVLRRRAPGG